MTEFVGSFLQLEWNGIHVWQRDIAQPGWNGFEPGNTPLASAVCDELRIALLRIGDRRSESINIPTSIGDKVIEVIIDAPNRWWIGSKIVQSTEACWPGGIFNIDKPDDMISRAYLKISEAMAWARWQIRPGDKVVEIGSSPGGSVQRLLDLGAKVTGIDPAEMDERIAKHPNFVHLRSRSLQVKRKLFRNFKYLICDANVAPKYTLDTVESIVTYPTSRFKALLLTMKLPSWEQSLEISSHLERVQSWGFERVMARQLSHNRQEYCLSALRLKTRDSASLKNVQEEQSRTEVDGESL